MEKFKNFIKLELDGWSKIEILSTFFILTFVLINAIILKDSIVAILSAIFGILYTILAGKGKITCYFFGLMGSSCYSYLSFKNGFYGQLALYMCYFIPMQITGIFKWKKHLKNNSHEIIKNCLNFNQKIKFLIIATLLCSFMITILWYLKDANPLIDGITTALSLVGMYFTVKRYIEQWQIWMVVNGLTLFMWLNIVITGVKAYSTAIMWGIYFILAIYFYFTWKKELKNKRTV